MANVEKYDGIVVGSGQSGKPLAVKFANAGWKMALIERDQVGGTCVNYGCTPTKTMVAGARVAYLSRRAKDYGVNAGNVTVDMAAVRARKQKIVDSFRGGSERQIENTKNLELIRGQARFIESKIIEVALNDGGTRQLAADKIFINTGGRNIVPDMDGLSSIDYLDSTSIMELDSLPEHLVVVGGGYIGLEFGQMFRRYGSEVTIISRGAHLLDREDTDVSEEVARIIRDDGIEVLLNCEPHRVEMSREGKILLQLNSNGESQEVVGTHILVAVGRKAETESLNLNQAGIATDDKGNIKVNSKLETTAEGIYAIGDVKGGPAFTHISYDDFRLLKTNLLEKGNASIDGRLVPYAVFIDPQLGRVGLSEREAKEKGLNFRVGRLPMTHVARALEMDETRGFMKVIVDVDNDQILGCAILGVEGGEIMSVIQMAMMGKVPYTRIRDGVFAHPLLSESLNNLFMAMDR